MTTTLRVGFVLVLGLVTAACGGSGGEATCTPGTAGCACLDDGTCAGAGLTCADGLCRAPLCEPGTDGCPCFGNGTCNAGLACSGGTCGAAPACPQGTDGCPCRADGNCDDGLACESGACATPTTCPAGTLGCPCSADGTCADGLTCTEGACATPKPCAAGSEGCACGADDACGVTSLGEVLECQAGTCVAASCPAGQGGCACRNGATCDDAGDACVDGFCQAADCVAGSEGCACAGGSCKPGLTCRDGAVCVDATGLMGGPCYDDGTCSQGFRCQGGSCVPCALGSPSCACKADGTCQADLACVDGLCADAGTTGPLPPPSPRCYTPCNADLVLPDGTLKPCSSEGLLEGCLDGKVCTEGSCTAPGQAKPVCAKPTDCPFFQDCLAGGCYSDCESNADCTDGRVCHAHVCRVPCAASQGDGQSACDDGQACVTGDGSFGVCLPVEAPSGTPATASEGSFRLSLTAVPFSNVTTSATITLTNDGPTFETFTLRKLRHVAYLADGTTDQAEDPDDATACNPAVDCPLTWLKIGPLGDVQPVTEVQVGVEGQGGQVVLHVEGAGGGPAPKWDGRLEVVHPRYGRQIVVLAYSERPEGRWGGNLYYFANFGTEYLDDWRAVLHGEAASGPHGETLPQLAALVGNAFIQRWWAFRTGNISWEELLAVATSTQVESWRWATVEADCPASQGACYPFDGNELGLGVYSSDTRSRPVPSGVVEMPFAMDLTFPQADDLTHMSGRIVTNVALQYPADPAVTLTLGADPATCQSQAGGACLVFLNGLHAEADLGGRYVTDSSDEACDRTAGGYRLARVPWLVPGFERATETDPETGLRYRYECRDGWLPRNPGQGVEWPEDMLAANADLSAANPIPDARARRRSFEIVDGALVNQAHLFLIFRETYESFLPDDDQPFAAYGFMLLARQAIDLDLADADGDEVPDTFEGSTPSDGRTEPDDVLDVACSPDLVERVLGYGNRQVTAANADDLVAGLLDGVVPSTTTPATLGASSDEAVHYLCVANGLFDGGSGAVTSPWAALPNNDGCGKTDWPNPSGGTTATSPYAGNGACDDGGPDADTAICPVGTDRSDCGLRSASDGDFRVACPAGSDVVYFTVDADQESQADVASEPCQQDGSCEQTLADWREAGTPLVQYEPVWRCTDANQVYCDGDRLDLRAGKTFFEAYEESAKLTPLYAAIDQAFRYKTQFRDREGKSVAFAPEVCVPDSNQIPYCYDPAEIEAARERVDCLLSVWRHHYADVGAASAATRTKLDDYLCTDFAYAEACHGGLPATAYPHDGFERLYAELLVMMGDESTTRAFASRFDLAGQSGATFEGTLFEDGGVDLSGAAGVEMLHLYRAAQYYQEALDRFYALSPLFWEALEYGQDAQQPAGRNFVTQETVTWYLERLTRAATQKSRAWSAVAEKYQNLNRPDLARRVVERAYVATYLESMMLSQLMVRVTETLKPEDRPQVALVLDEAQKRYRMAMLDMRNAYAAITDEVDFFGLPPDYIPFPTLNQYEDNAFEAIQKRAQQKMEIAKYREDLAIQKNTAFETDTEEFQAELVRLRMNYEGQLGDLCGTFEGSDGKIYPAIPRYAYLNADARAYGDPCGQMGNGVIHEARVAFEQSRLDLQKMIVAEQNVLGEVDIERSRVEAQCALILDMAAFTYSQGDKVRSLEKDIAGMRLAINGLDRILGVFSGTLGFLTGSLEAKLVAPAYLLAAGIANGAALGLEGGILKLQDDIAKTNLKTARWQTEAQCSQAIIDSNARTATLMLQMRQLELDALRATHQVQLALSEIQQQQNRAKRLEQELGESEQLAINVAAARNDPNVRIYRNDAIVNADVAFKDAMSEAWRLTRVYEYYTATTYAARDKLFLVRMVQYGDLNLENYLTDLQNDYWAFEETYGWPETRVTILSLRDDIFRIPQTDDAGTPLSQADRIDRMRERLTDPVLLDENGYIRIPFSTTLTELSPLTRNHKIKYLEAEVIGSDVGDTLGRLYLRQQGTSTVHGLDDSKVYYRFPQKTAIVNPFFNGNRVFDPDVYRSRRLLDRPYVNTSWELYVNQRDELENQDVDLRSLTDVRIYVYYADFTAF
jgi:hypothetical protein